ncbi:MAG: YncE family protein [Candidatus Limnocylindrales bacterium]
MTSDSDNDQLPDDEEIGRLVRDVVSEWRQPPQRLGQAMWRDRLGRRMALGPRPTLLRRLGGAVTVAVAATLVVAVGFAWLNSSGGPRPGVGSSASPGSTPTPDATTAVVPTASPAPKLVVYGAAPQASAVLVYDGDGLRKVDLRTGDLTTTDACAGINQQTFLRLPDGGVLALCLARAPRADGLDITATLERIGPGGGVSAQFLVGTYSGRSDPAAAPSARADPVNISASVGPDGRIYVGWAEQQGSKSWRLGIDAVTWPPGASSAKIPGAYVSQHFALPALRSSDVTGMFTGPLVRIAPDGKHAVIHSHDYTFQSQGRRYDWSVAMAANGTFASPVAWPASGAGTLADASCAGSFSDGSDEGFASATTYFAVCGQGPVALSVVGLDGSPVGASATFNGGFTSNGLIDRARNAYLAWDPFNREVSRIDLSTLKVSTMALGTGAVSADPLAGLGRALGAWLVPTAAAKVFLLPSMILSPDGSRLYVIGSTGTFTASDASSTGIWVIDPVSLAVLGHWPPTADYVSIGLSADGTELYAAAGAGGISPNSPGTANLPASVTVFDASTGAVKAVAGQLGQFMLLFIGDGGSAFQ